MLSEHPSKSPRGVFLTGCSGDSDHPCKSRLRLFSFLGQHYQWVVSFVHLLLVGFQPLKSTNYLWVFGLPLFAKTVDFLVDPQKVKLLAEGSRQQPRPNKRECHFISTATVLGI